MNKIKLLLIDDEELWSQEFKTWLESTNEFQVEIEPFGSGAREHALNFKPDIILMDWLLKHEVSFGAMGDGVAVANKLRGEHPELDKTPILIVTKHDPADASKNLGSIHETKGIFVVGKSLGSSRGNRTILACIGNALFRWAQQIKFDE